MSDDQLTCDRVREQLALWVTGDLVPEAERAVAGHLAGCPACREEADVWRDEWPKVAASARRSDPEGPPEEALTAAVNAALGARPGPGFRRSRGLRRVVVVAATLAFLLVIRGFWMEDVDENPAAVAVTDPMRAEAGPTVTWSELQEFFDDCLSAPVAPARFEGSGEPGLLAVLARDEDGERYRVLACISAPDLSGVHGYPWLDQRLSRLRAAAGDAELVVTACGTGNLDGTTRRRVRREFAASFLGEGGS